MKPFEKCPVCGGGVEEREVEKILRGGNHTAVLRLIADVCLRCGERLYTEDAVRFFDKVRNKLKRQELAGLQPVGQSFVLEDGACDIAYKSESSE